ncbi:MAG: T9SS type A sorting domain-containing protein, partial [Bacteroidota bacterium]
VATLAKSLLVGHLIREGSDQEALSLSLELIDDSDPLIAKTALFNAGNIAWYALGDESKGREYFDKLIARYPGEPEAHSAEATMGIWEPQFAEKGGPALGNEAETSELSLQSYPNPFNPATEIRFSIPEDGFVNLRVYDVLGRVVATLVDEVRQAGPYRVQWNAANVPSGVYFSRLETQRGAVVSKLLLVR